MQNNPSYRKKNYSVYLVSIPLTVFVRLHSYGGTKVYMQAKGRFYPHRMPISIDMNGTACIQMHKTSMHSMWGKTVLRIDVSLSTPVWRRPKQFKTAPVSGSSFSPILQCMMEERKKASLWKKEETCNLLGTRVLNCNLHANALANYFTKQHAGPKYCLLGGIKIKVEFSVANIF